MTKSSNISGISSPISHEPSTPCDITKRDVRIRQGSTPQDNRSSKREKLNTFLSAFTALSLIALVVNELAKPPSMLPDENRKIFQGAVATIGAGQASALGATLLPKLASEWSKKNPKLIKALQVISAGASCAAGGGFLANPIMLSAPIKSYLTPASFELLGLIKGIALSGKFPQEIMSFIASAATTFATAGLGLFTEGQSEDNDISGTVLAGISTTLFAVNSANSYYSIMEKRRARTATEEPMTDDNAIRDKPDNPV